MTTPNQRVENLKQKFLKILNTKKDNEVLVYDLIITSLEDAEDYCTELLEDSKILNTLTQKN